MGLSKSVRRGFLGLLLGAVVLFGRAAHADGQTWAVLIGVSEYRYRNQITPLGGAANDARALRRILRERLQVPEDHIQLLVAEPGRTASSADPIPDRSEILSAMERLRYSVKPDDTIWVFFAGHGISVKNQTYLLPYDASNLSDTSLVNTALRVDEIKNVINGIPARARILMFDMCRSEPRAGSRDVGAANNLTPTIVRSLDFTPPPPVKTNPTKPPITVTLFACSPGQRSYELEDKGRGYFTYTLEEGLGGKAANKQGQVTADGLAYYVREKVKSAVATRLNRDQIPLSHLNGVNANAYVLTTVKPGTPEWVPTVGNPDPTPNPNGGDPNPNPNGGEVVARPGGITTPDNKTPFPNLGTQSARVEFYSNDPAITVLLNGAEVSSGGGRTETFSSSAQMLTYEVKAPNLRVREQGTTLVTPGQAKALLALRTTDGSINQIKWWPSYSDFSKKQLVSEIKDEKDAKKGMVSGAWELSGWKMDDVNQFTQTMYKSQRSIASADPAHPDEEQQLVVAEAYLKNNTNAGRDWLPVRVEGSDTYFPYDGSVLIDNDGKEYPLIAQDAATDNDLRMHFNPGQKRLVRWIFRFPKNVSFGTVDRAKINVLWIPSGGSAEKMGQPERVQFVIRRTLSGVKPPQNDKNDKTKLENGIQRVKSIILK